MQYSENYHMNKPELADQYNLSHWNENTDTIDSAMQDIRSGMDATMKATLLNFCYPIGSIYWSSNSTNPATLFGGTWVQIKDKFVWAKGDSDTVDSTGGAKTVTLTVNNLPEHTHAIGGNTGEESGHTHNMSHHHSSGTLKIIGSTENSVITERKDGVVGSGALRIEKASRTNSIGDSGTKYWGYGTLTIDTSRDNSWSGLTSTPKNSSGTAIDNTGAGSSHHHSLPNNTGNNTTTNVAVDKMPPYVVKYCWERTA